jgi:hypothetical protein
MITKESLKSFQYGRQERGLSILSTTDAGTWVLALPVELRPHQPELESMLNKVFSGSLSSPDNLALAQQLSLNWCMSKARGAGISVEECFPEFSR